MKRIHSVYVVNRNRKQKKRNEDDILERGETTPVLDSCEKSIDPDKLITKYQQADLLYRNSL